MLSPRRGSHMIEKTSSNGSSAIRRDWSQLPAASSPGTIRVIHIFAPKVIKTDVANFRALVQKLTGKSKKGGSGSGSRMRAPKSRSLTSSEGNFSSSTDTSTIQSSAGAETCSESSTRSSNSASPVADSNSTMARSAFLFSSPDSCTTSASPKFFGLPSSFDSSQAHHQVLRAEISDALFRSQACTASSSNSESNNNNNNNSHSNNQSSVVMVDPLQSLSGYKDNWASLQASCNFSCSLKDQDHASDHEQQQQSPIQSHSRQVPHNMSLNANGFSDMDILTGLVSPGPLPEFSLPPPLHNNNNNNHISINNNSVPTTSEHFLLSNHPSVCRLSVQSLLRGSVSPFEHF